MKHGEELRFKYSALFQSVEILVKRQNDIIACDADLKLPILKKSYETTTQMEPQTLLWKLHTPVVEKGTKLSAIEKTAATAHALDPIGFFLTLHQEDWLKPSVDLLIGAKIVSLEVEKIKEGYIIKRKDKDQKLIIKKDQKGISSLEVPIPIIGSIAIKRV